MGIDGPEKEDGLLTGDGSLTLELEEFRLANGLRVVLLPEDSLPVAAVSVWYYVGSKNDPAERTGLAHLFEHLMFEGSAGYDGEYFRPLQEAGASVNGSTSNDRTNYYEVIPRDFLERALWLEADRMGRLAPALSLAKLDNQRGVVKNERLQRVENAPYGRVGETLSGLFYPLGHPYSWPILGWLADLDRIELADAQAFLARHYQPGAACLAIAGSFDRDDVRRWVDAYFGPIPGRPRPAEPVVVDSFEQSIRRARLTEDVALGRLDIAWPTGPRFHPDEPALDFVAEILAGGSKSSRLYRRMVKDERLAVNVHAGNATQKLAGRMVLRSYAFAGGDLGRIESAADAEIEALAAAPPDETEMERVRNTLLMASLARVETALGRAEAVQQYLFHQDECPPDAILAELESYRRVTPAEVSAAARKYLPVGKSIGDGRAIVAVAPDPAMKRLAANLPPPPPFHRPPVAADALPCAGRPGEFLFPAAEEAAISGAFRARAIVARKLPRIDLQLVVSGGAAARASISASAADSIRPRSPPAKA